MQKTKTLFLASSSLTNIFLGVKLKYSCLTRTKRKLNLAKPLFTGLTKVSRKDVKKLGSFERIAQEADIIKVYVYKALAFVSQSKRVELTSHQNELHFHFVVTLFCSRNTQPLSYYGGSTWHLRTAACRHQGALSS